MIGTIRGVTTGILLLVFIVLIGWAWSGRRKALFDSMARMPLDEDTADKSTDEDDVHE